MDKKSWAYTTAILMLLEYIVFNWAYMFGADKNLTDHVSFAGTIVSIILAVVAIIYSFIQTESQNRSSSQIAQQITSLKETAIDIDLSKSRFSQELDRIDGIANKLDAVNSEILTSHQKVDSVANAVSAIQRKLDQLPTENAADIQTLIDDPKKLAAAILNRTSFEADVLSCSLQHYLNLTGKDTFGFSEFVVKFFSDPIRAVTDTRNFPELFASANQILATLCATGLMTYNDGIYAIPPSLKSILPQLAKQARATNCDWVKQAIARIDLLQN